MWEKVRKKGRTRTTQPLGREDTVVTSPGVCVGCEAASHAPPSANSPSPS